MGHIAVIARRQGAEDPCGGLRRRGAPAAFDAGEVDEAGPRLLSQFGHLLETFVVAELVRQASWIDGVSTCGHWRTHDGDEVDLVVERDDGVVLAFEVKAGRRVTSTDARHLRKLREALGERFLLGVVLHTGAHAYRVEDRLHAMPVDRLWAPV